MAIGLPKRHLSTRQIGVIFLSLCVVGGAVLFMKTSISADLRSGETVKVEFSRDYKLRADVTKVKVAGVPIGIVTSVEPAPDSGGALVELKVDEGIRETLGSAPSAAIRPTTILGGNYYVDLVPGGDRGVASEEPIPVDRTLVPVELDSAIEMLSGSARDAIRGDVKSLDATFNGPATPALRQLARTSPEALESSAKMLSALSGTQPSTDLTQVITGLKSIARQLSENPVALSDDLDGVDSLARTLARQKSAISETVRNAPSTLRNTRSGLAELSTVLDKTTRVGESARPSVRALTTLLREGRPDVDAIRPVVVDLRPLMEDLDPTVRSLVPTSKNLKAVVDDVRSPVIDRISGPVLKTLNSPTAGKGSPLGYQQIAYFFTTLNLNSMTTDSNGAMINFQPGVGPDTLTEFTPSRIMKTWRSMLGQVTGGAR